MFVSYKQYRRILVWLLLFLLFAALVYAVADLAGQANKSAADAGSAGFELETASVASIKQSKSKPVNWGEEQRLRGKMTYLDNQYKGLVNKARSETASIGHVAPGTRNAGIACANKYLAASENYAAFWEKNNGKTRARVARSAGRSRVKNAEMTFNDIDSSRVKAYNNEQEELAKARREYLKEAKNDVSESDRLSMKAGLKPQLERSLQTLQSLVTTVTSLIMQVKNQMGGDVVGVVGGCARQVVMSGVSDGPAGLLAPLTSLLSLVQSMASNISTMISDLASL